ncbi:beta-glucan synthesis-associated protein KRE6 [Coprinopsis cinerea AmutBmut pab1-1]|nr:beta-glucan synthesis-associated protein KRE6 [Coprinopsis cinerea AmutBmut pab1-1]
MTVKSQNHGFTQLSSVSATSLLVPEGGKDSGSQKSKISAKYSLPPSPRAWGLPLTMEFPEPDDALHNPDPRRDKHGDRGGHIFTSRGIANLGCMFVLCMGMLALFAGRTVR